MLKKILSFTALITFSMSMYAQENITYQKPSEEILTLADFEMAPAISMNSTKDQAILVYRNTYKTLDDLNQEEMRLGGLRINPKTSISSTMTFYTKIKVKNLLTQMETEVKNLPQSAKITYLTWSPDEKKIAFINNTNQGNELWYIDLDNAQAHQLTQAELNANTGNPITWFKDSQQLLVKIQRHRYDDLTDKTNAIPNGPIVSASEGGVESQNRTYQDLLKDKIDEENFEKLITTDLYRIDLSGNKKLFKSADMFISESFSPDGKYLMITTLQKPFSYIVPFQRFPMKTTVYTANGDRVKVVNELPLNEVMPKGFMSVRQGKRSLRWRSDKPSSLFYVQALDEGDQANEVEFRDELFSWDAPFNKNPESLAKTSQRYGGIIFGNNQTAIVYDQWYDTRNIKTYLLNPSTKNMKVINDRNYQDVYADPGDFQTERNEFGQQTLLINNHKMYLIGDGYSANGKFPFIDEYDMTTDQSSRIYQSTLTDKLEDISSIIDIDSGKILVNIQSKTDYPNYYFRNIFATHDDDSLTKVTDNQNPFESLNDVHKEVIKYQRKDGVELSGTLYLPKGYMERENKEKLPLLIWAYPTEYKDKNSAGQSTANPNEFTFPYYGSFVYWVAKGYAVLDDAAFPIIGEGETEPNDTFIEQLIWNAEAAIDALDEKGYIDRTKVGVGGHSYGAFMTANLLTHSDLFACGIARSGAYNRTLTPFGFQREQRNYWEASDVYNTMSPFMNAEKMKKPMLLVHGEADNNPGTFTLQTERYFQALKGLGAPVRMVILPKESHGYVAKENILHLLWEQEQFLDKHLKGN
ncbi:alpha/beta hydrolase family protein [Avrilella dinanensis]|uniref:alpha/beta hydrolase family protein n=1 Tax=Avrilella dinanensis TaxID=2008672 RepID=UPI00240A5A7D|nr:prolyl oligopeptidase family serine peptidase [Avrilella dinanensis]